MSHPTPRPTRSQVSSPFGAALANTAATEMSNKISNAAEKPKTFLDRWVEPPLPPPLPSFAEAGIERHGVVANMAPLGTRPSIKVLKSAVKPELVDGGRRVTMAKKSGASAVPGPTESSMVTPEPTANHRRRRSVSTKGEDPDYAPRTPQQQSSPRKSVPRSVMGGQGSAQGIFSVPQSPSAVDISHPPVDDDEREINLEQTDRVVESAVQEALDHRRWPTAFALRTLYDDHRSDNSMVWLIEAIYDGRADVEQRKEFDSLMRAKKREGKRDRTGEYYFNGDGSDPPPRAPQFSAINSLSSSTASRRGSTGARRASDAQARLSSINHSSLSASPQKEHDPAQHVSKKHKGNSFQPSDVELNGSLGGANGKTKPQQHSNGTSNRVRRGRSNSNSSSSSLSSIDEQILDGEYHDGSVAIDAATDTPPRFASPSYSNNNNNPPSADTPDQPITSPPQPVPKTLSLFSTAAVSSSFANTTNAGQYDHDHDHDHDQDPTTTSMPPAALLACSASSSSSSTPGQAPLTALQQLPAFPAKKALNKATGRPYDEHDTASRLKRKARYITESNVSKQDSFERHQPAAPTPQEVDSTSDGGDSIAMAASKRPTKVRLLHNHANKRFNYDSEDLSSPTLMSFQADLAPGSVTASRAGTPNNFNRPTRKAKTGTGLRVKTSPMKKKGGTLAGIPRASGERNSPIGNGAHNQDENDDYCSSCGGNGDLVCCDGCTRSFHFKCVDPPMIEGSLPDEWYCNVCLTSRVPRAKDGERGSFGSLLANLERKNPSAFHLPKAIREYFVDVKTGAEGEYEEGVSQRPKNRAGYDEAQDYFRLKDSKGNTILCHQCHGSASNPDRMIIPCSFCGLSWHLDCLDPPMAKEPPLGKTWRCPAHIDDLLVQVPGSLGPAHRFRRIKGAPVITPAISRGVKNNGHIEIENSTSDDEERGFYEQREYGHVYKLPEEGIKLDFISQVRRKTGGGYAPSRLITRIASPQLPTVVAPVAQRSIIEQQAALNLVQLVSETPGLGDASLLINTLIAEAPPAVIEMIGQGDSNNIAEGKLTEMDRASLIALRALIDSKIAIVSIEVPRPQQEEETADVKVEGDGREPVDVKEDVEMEL